MQIQKILFAALVALVSPIAIAQKECYPYVDQNGLECVLTWNQSTGASTLFYYAAADKSFAASPYQLPVDAAMMGSYACAPYLDQNGLECVFVWNKEKGSSVLYYYAAATKTFEKSPYQLPANPIGDAGITQYEPYLDQDGAECVLVTNQVTGASKLYYYAAATKSFELSPYQLPAKPTEDEGKYFCIPYLDQDGAECVFAYNSVTGKSILYYYAASEKAFVKSPYQLAVKPTGDAGEFHFKPYLDQDGAECVLAYNSTTGKSVLYYYAASTKSFTEAPYQLPANPTGDSGKIEFHPYLDQHGAECVLVWNSTTGTSKLYYYDASDKAFQLAPYQLTTLK